MQSWKCGPSDSAAVASVWRACDYQYCQNWLKAVTSLGRKDNDHLTFKMTLLAEDAPLDIRFGHEALPLRGWPSDGVIRLGDWAVGHALQPPDQVAYSALASHLLVLSLHPNDRQVIQFAGQEYDGVGWQQYNLFLLPAGMPAQFAWESEDEVIFWDIPPEALCRTAAQIDGLNPEHIEIKPLLMGRDDHITRFAQCFLHEIHTGGLGDRLCSESLLTSFAIHLLRHYCTYPAKLPNPQGGLSKRRLRRALEVIHTSLDQSLSIEAIASEVGLDMYYFSRLFRQSMGVSPYQYVLQQRVERAKTLLKQSELTITEVALECGFAHSSQLARHFRKTIGLSPKAYRQQEHHQSGSR